MSSAMARCPHDQSGKGALAWPWVFRGRGRTRVLVRLLTVGASMAQLSGRKAPVHAWVILWDSQTHWRCTAPLEHV